MIKEQKKDLFEKNYDILWVINLFGNWVFQAQLMRLAGKLGYNSESNLKQTLKILENYRLIRREKWNGNFKVVKLANFSLERLTPGSQNRSSVQLPKNSHVLIMRVLKTELMIDLILRFKKEKVTNKDIEKLPYIDYDTLLLRENYEGFYLIRFYEKFQKYIDSANYKDIFESTAFGIYNSKKGLLGNQEEIYDNNLVVSKKVYDKMISNRIPYIRDFDLTKVLSTNLVIKQIIFKNNIFNIKILYLTTNAIDIKPILFKFKKIESLLRMFFRYEVNINVNFEIITTSEEKKQYIEKSIQKMKRQMDITVSSKNLNDKYFLKRNFI